MKQTTSTDLAAKGVVSIWLGNLRSEVELYHYLGWNEIIGGDPPETDAPFQMDFGCSLNLYESEWPEVPSSFVPGRNSDASERDIRSIFEVFRWSDQWIERAVEAAHAKGWTKAITVFAYFGMQYDESLAKAHTNPPLVYIGSFSYDVERDETPICDR